MELLNSTTNNNTIQYQAEDQKKSSEKKAKQNIESYYSKKNLEKYLINSSIDTPEHMHNKKYLQNKVEKSPENYAENRAHFFRINYKKPDNRIEGAINNDHQRKILETRYSYKIMKNC